jgi:hypothetical protein
MTPETFFQWAVAVGFGSGIVLFFIPVHQWVSNILASKAKRLKHLEDRVASLERQVASNQKESS